MPVLRQDAPHLAPPERASGLARCENNEQDRQTLLEQGGKIKVPCLRIEEGGKTTWMYESKVIIDYLNNRFANV